MMISTRRRRKDILDDLQELDGDCIPKKKVKLDDESSSQKAFSRLRKTVRD